MSKDTVQSMADGTGLRIGIVQSRFNAYATEALLEACMAELLRLGVAEEDIWFATVGINGRIRRIGCLGGSHSRRNLSF